MADDAYEALRTAILTGKLLPSERLVEADLVESLGVRRTAVRAALARLAHEGLVEHERNRGAKVRRVGEREAVEILETRTVLEGLVARKAAENATADDIAELRAIVDSLSEAIADGDLLGSWQPNVRLHAAIFRIADHRTVERVATTLNSQLVRFQYRTILQPGRPEESLAEHVAIVEAIADGDGERAEAAMRSHLSQVTETLRAAVAADAIPNFDVLAASQ